MTTKTIDCNDCGASVAYGRLSCPACGALLASVVGRPAPEAVATFEPEPEPFLLPDDEVPPTPAWLRLPGEPPVPAPRSSWGSLADEPTDEGTLSPTPAPYRSSGLTLSGAVAGGSSWSAPATETATAAPPATKHAGATVRSRLGPLDPVRFAEIAGWFVVVGATMTVLGFLLPWSRVVIGARSVGGYSDTWGLASPTHVIVLAATMLVLALAIVQTSVPAWVRTAVMPLALGSLLIGLTWPYQVGPLGADVGVLVVALGGLALVIGGVVASWATRHVEVDRVV